MKAPRMTNDTDEGGAGGALPAARATRHSPSRSVSALRASIANAVHIFLDCDGVLADFDTYAEAYFGMPPRVYEAKVGASNFWRELEAKGDFYRNLPLMPDARELVAGVAHLNPTILTGCPRGNWAEAQKVAWAEEHFPGIPVITCRSADKRVHANPGDVLIDDWPQHRHRWIEMGGVFISHFCAATSLAALWAHYPELTAQGMARAAREREGGPGPSGLPSPVACDAPHPLNQGQDNA